MLKAVSILHDAVKGYRTILWNVITGLVPLITMFLPLPLTLLGPKYTWVIMLINVLGNLVLRYLTKGPVGDKECHK